MTANSQSFHPGDFPRIQNIILGGFMGSGKTTVGRILAQRLEWTFLDTDKMIEERAEHCVEEIFRQLGERKFRDMESTLAQRLGSYRNCVIATGGGFLVPEENREAAARAGVVILLVASPQEIWHRVSQSRHRPLLQVEDPLARIEELLRERQPAYSAIPTQIITDGRMPNAVADEVMERLRAE